MRKELLVIGFVTLLVCAFLSGCNEASNPEVNKFVGTWRYGENDNALTVTFSADGKFIYGTAALEGTWTVQDGTLHTTANGESGTQTYSFSNNNTTLNIGPRDVYGFEPGNYTKQ